MFTGYYVELSSLKKHIRDLPKRYFNSFSMHTVFETSWIKKTNDFNSFILRLPKSRQ